MAPAFSLNPGKGILHLLPSRKPSQKSEQSRLLVPGILQIPDFILSVCWPSAYQAVQCTCIQSQACQLSFKTPNFRTRAGPLGKSLAALGLM